MATHCPFCRSSYFQVKDPAAFEAFCRKWAVRMIRGGKRDRLFGFLSEGEVGLPLSYYDAEKDDWVDGDFLKELSTHYEKAKRLGRHVTVCEY